MIEKPVGRHFFPLYSNLNLLNMISFTNAFFQDSSLGLTALFWVTFLSRRLLWAYSIMLAPILVRKVPLDLQHYFGPYSKEYTAMQKVFLMNIPERLYQMADNRIKKHEWIKLSCYST